MEEPNNPQWRKVKKKQDNRNKVEVVQPKASGKKKRKSKKARQRAIKKNYAMKGKAYTGKTPNGIKFSGGQNRLWDDKQHKVWADWIKNFETSGPSIDVAGKSYVMNGFYTNNVTNNAKIQVSTTGDAAIGIACAILSHANEHGFRVFCVDQNSPNDPYLAFCFIVNTMWQVMQGQQANVPKVDFPDYLLEILSAIQPKTGMQCGAGTLGYSWVLVGSPSLPPASFLFPSIIGSGKYCFGETSTTINGDGYNLMLLTSGGYSDLTGANAFQNLTNFMGSRLNYKNDRYNPFVKRTFSLVGTKLERSASAFSSTNPVIGAGVSGGFVNSVAALETSVKHQKFAVFADPTQKLSRGFRNYRAAGGDATWLVCSILQQVLRGEYSNPNYPAFKPVDFYEFAERLAMICVRLFEYYYADKTVTQSITNLGINAMQFLIILRKTLMRAFGGTQYGVQSLRFYTSTSGDEFIPLLCGSNCTSSNQGVAMTLPLFYVENMNALRPRATWNNINPKTGRLVKKNPKCYIPVLGAYDKYAFNSKLYTYQSGEGTTSIFAPDSGDGPISIIDGTQGSDFVDLDCSPAIAAQIMLYNKAMTVLGSYIQAPTTYTGDGGVNVLAVIADTYIVTEIPVKNKDCDKKGDKKDKKEKKDKKLPTITTEDKKFVARTSIQKPIGDLNMIKKAFINPEYKEQKISSGIGSINLETTRTLNQEMAIEVLGTKFAGTSLDGAYEESNDSRKQFVDLCVRAKDAPPSTIILQIQELTKNGEAGILGSLATAFGGVLVNTAGAVLNQYLPY